jgi:hypothetical protein
MKKVGNMPGRFAMDKCKLINYMEAVLWQVHKPAGCGNVVRQDMVGLILTKLALFYSRGSSDLQDRTIEKNDYHSNFNIACGSIISKRYWRIENR